MNEAVSLHQSGHKPKFSKHKRSSGLQDVLCHALISAYYPECAVQRD